MSDNLNIRMNVRMSQDKLTRLQDFTKQDKPAHAIRAAINIVLSLEEYAEYGDITGLPHIKLVKPDGQIIELMIVS